MVRDFSKKLFFPKYKKGYRSKFIEDVLGKIQRAESFSIIGMPGLGKNDLYQHFDKNYRFWKTIFPKKKINFLFVFLDSTQLLDISPIGFYRFFLDKLCHIALNNIEDEAVLNDIKKIHEKSVSSTDLFTIYTAAKDIIQVITEQYNFKLCILIHDFATFTGFKKQFFNSLKALRNVNKWKVTIAFSSDSDLFKIYNSDKLDELYNLMANDKVYLALPSIKEADLIMDEWEEECGYKLPRKARDKLIELSAGHPGFMKSLNSYCQETKTDLLSIKTEDIKDLSNRIKIRARSEKFWIKLTDEDKELLVNIIKNPKMTLDKSTDYLKRTEIIKDVNGSYEIFTPLLYHFIKRTEKISNGDTKIHKAGVWIDPKTSNIYINGDKLQKEPTKSELKILNLLYKNKGNIVDRESLARAIWGKHIVEKYSDWAIDRTISRLRKKIGDRPRNPRYIETVKGRGLRLLV